MTADNFFFFSIFLQIIKKNAMYVKSTFKCSYMQKYLNASPSNKSSLQCSTATLQFFSNCIMLYAVYRSTSSTLNEKTKEMKENVHINCESAVKGNKINRSSVSDLQPFKVVLLQKKNYSYMLYL